MSIKEKIKSLKKQRKSVRNSGGDTHTLDVEINQAETQELDARKQEKELEKKALINEARGIIVKTYGTLKRLGIVQTKWDMSELFNRSRSYFLVLESRKSQPLSYESLKALKENLQEIKYHLHLFLEENDENYKQWVSRKLDETLSEIERLELKTLKVMYGVPLV